MVVTKNCYYYNVVNYFTELGHVDEVQREELHSPDTHPNVGTINENITVASKSSFLSCIGMLKKLCYH